MRLLAPIPTDRRVRRFSQLLVGLVLYGITMAMMVRAVLGLDPWDVFHQGLTALVNRWVPLSYGTVITIVSVFVLLLWIPLRQRPGIGTIANAAIIGFTTDAALSLIPEFENLTVRIVVLVLAIVGNAVAGALYIGAGLGPGPRDGLMTGLVARGIGTIRLVRTTIELSVLGIGWILGGVVGVGTVLYALSIGPLLHVLLPRLQVRSTGRPEPALSTTGDAPFTEAEGR
ncbi:membrane protein YczE [Nakamurella sp. GG22]